MQREFDVPATSGDPRWPTARRSPASVVQEFERAQGRGGQATTPRCRSPRARAGAARRQRHQLRQRRRPDAAAGRVRRRGRERRAAGLRHRDPGRLRPGRPGDRGCVGGAMVEESPPRPTFAYAASEALWDGARDAGPALLEPVMSVEVVVPDGVPGRRHRSPERQAGQDQRHGATRRRPRRRTRRCRSARCSATPPSCAR